MPFGIFIIRVLFVLLEIGEHLVERHRIPLPSLRAVAQPARTATRQMHEHQTDILQLGIEASVLQCDFPGLMGGRWDHRRRFPSSSRRTVVRTPLLHSPSAAGTGAARRTSLTISATDPAAAEVPMDVTKETFRVRERSSLCRRMVWGSNERRCARRMSCPLSRTR